MASIVELSREKQRRGAYASELSMFNSQIIEIIEYLRKVKEYFENGGYYVDGQTLDQCGPEMSKDLEKWIDTFEGNIDKVNSLKSANDYYIDELDALLKKMREANAK